MISLLIGLACQGPDEPDPPIDDSSSGTVREKTVKNQSIRYLSTKKNRSAATTLLAAVLDRYATGPRSSGATFWIPGVKTEKTAKKRRKNEQKWARYSLKRVKEGS